MQQTLTSDYYFGKVINCLTIPATVIWLGSCAVFTVCEVDTKK